jgi:hypothetical protein
VLLPFGEQQGPQPFRIIGQKCGIRAHGLLNAQARVRFRSRRKKNGDCLPE